MAIGKKPVIFAILVAVCIPVGFFGTHLYRKNILTSAYAQLEPGASKKDVLDLLGRPDETVVCESHENCKDVYVYYVFMERRGFVFNTEDKVIQKYSNSGLF